MGASVAAEAEWSASEEDSIAGAVARLAGALPAREDARVLTDLLEEELREGLQALEVLQAHFAGLLDAVGAGRASPLRLLTAAEDAGAREQAEALVDLLPQVRRRLALAAAMLQRGPRRCA